jgi:hypothetical protein
MHAPLPADSMQAFPRSRRSAPVRVGAGGRSALVRVGSRARERP